MTPFEHLLAPGRIGSMTTRNRLVMSPMETLFGTPEGLPSDRTVAYFAARAEGGVGLITVGATGIDHEHPETPGGLQIATPNSVAAHRRLVDAVHEHGARIQPQIVHAGPDGLGPEMFGVESLGPSVIQSYLTGRASAEIGPLQWAHVLDQYRAAANRVREAGYDGLELHAAHGYMLLGSFLAPVRNRRTDEFRGDRVRGRWRAVFEALAAIRGELGTDFPITLRVSGFERVAGGRPMYELARMAPDLVAAGIDAFHVSGGVIDRYVTQMVNGSDDGDALNVGAAAAVKEVVDVPVFAVGRIHDPAVAEEIIASGRADFVAMGRPMLADPEIAAKLAAGRPETVRRCISCENCIDAMEIRFSVDCAVNPRTGKETELAIVPAPVRKHLVVVGGGPGGLEAARVAAARGHRVTLLERNGQLGGALLWASIVHPENEPFLHWLRREVAEAEVDVRCNVEASVETVVELAPDAVVVATGGRVVTARPPGSDLPHVHEGKALRELLAGHPTGTEPRWQRAAARAVAGRGQRLLTPARVRRWSERWLPLGRRVAVVGGDLVAVELAEFLARRGRSVAIFEAGSTIAPEIGWKRKSEHMHRLDRLGVTAHTESVVTGIVDGGLTFVVADGPGRRHETDSIVLAGALEADTALYDALAARMPDVPVIAVGDCTGLGLIQKAVEDGARAGCSV